MVKSILKTVMPNFLKTFYIYVFFGQHCILMKKKF